MELDKIDRNTYIHRGSYEVKGTSNSKRKVKLTKKKPLSNNIEYISHLPEKYNTFGRAPKGYIGLINFVKSSPELISIIYAFVTDIISDGHYFEGSSKDVKIAEEFYRKNSMDEKYFNWLIDTFIYGNGFLVTNFVSKMQIKSFLESNVRFEVKSYMDLEEALRETIDEISKKNMIIQNLPAATVTISSTDIYGNNIIYTQKVGTNTVQFKSDEVIQLKDIDIDGKLYGYSRIYSIKSELELLASTKDYLGLFFQNNATPDKIFIAKNMTYGSNEYEAFKAQLKSFSSSENKRKNLLVTSELDVKNLNGTNDNTDNINIIKEITSILAMSFQMPPSRYGGSVKMTNQEASLSNQGYFRNILFQQNRIENVLNNQFWKKYFNVEFRFKRSYKEDELREVNIKKTTIDMVEQLLKIKAIKKEAVPKLLRNTLGLKHSDFDMESLSKNSDEEKLDGQYMQKNIKNREMLDENVLKMRLDKTPNKYKDESKNNIN